MTNQGYVLGKLDGAAAYLKDRIKTASDETLIALWEQAISTLMYIAVGHLQLPKGSDGAELLRERGYAHLLEAYAARNGKN